MLFHLLNQLPQAAVGEAHVFDRISGIRVKLLEQLNDLLHVAPFRDRENSVSPFASDLVTSRSACHRACKILSGNGANKIAGRDTFLQ